MEQEYPANFKSGFAALIGRPNVGKSTLMNAMVGQKIAITSNKPQTTRNRIRSVYTSKELQIVFVDTPGIHKVKNKLGNYIRGVAVTAGCGRDFVACGAVYFYRGGGKAYHRTAEKGGYARYFGDE